MDTFTPALIPSLHHCRVGPTCWSSSTSRRSKPLEAWAARRRRSMAHEGTATGPHGRGRQERTAIGASIRALHSDTMARPCCALLLALRRAHRSPRASGASMYEYMAHGGRLSPWLTCGGGLAQGGRMPSGGGRQLAGETGGAGVRMEGGRGEARTDRRRTNRRQGLVAPLLAAVMGREEIRAEANVSIHIG